MTKWWIAILLQVLIHHFINPSTDLNWHFQDGGLFDLSFKMNRPKLHCDPFSIQTVHNPSFGGFIISYIFCKRSNLLKTNYSNFRAWSSNKFEIATFFRQSYWLKCFLRFLIGLKEWQFQTFWKITLWN